MTKSNNYLCVYVITQLKTNIASICNFIGIIDTDTTNPSTKMFIDGTNSFANINKSYIDDSYFNIDIIINNVQNGVMEFEDCNNIKLPVDYESLTEQLGNFRLEQSGLTSEQKVVAMENIIDSISQNPSWKLFVPANFNASVSINTNVLKKIPLAVAAGVLTPKTLLPIFIMLSVLQTSATNSLNQAITSVNTNIASCNTLGNKTNNVINNGVDFLSKFRTFNINVISEIGAIYLKALFDGEQLSFLIEEWN